MQRLVPIIAAAAILSLPTVAYGVPITVHEEMRVQKEVVDYERVRGDAFVTPKTIMVTKVVEDVIHVPPRDRDDDGIADKEDDCIGYCPPPEPVYAEASTGSSYSSEYSGTGTSSSPVDGYAGAGGSTVQCESGGDYYVVDPSGTYWGGWQFDQQTWDAYAPSGEWGSATPAQQDAAAAAVPYDAWPNC